MPALLTPIFLELEDLIIREVKAVKVLDDAHAEPLLEAEPGPTFQSPLTCCHQRPQALTSHLVGKNFQSLCMEKNIIIITVHY